MRCPSWIPDPSSAVGWVVAKTLKERRKEVAFHRGPTTGGGPNNNHQRNDLAKV